MGEITGYAALTSPQPDDELVIVDVHDTTMAVTGTTKRITVANLGTTPAAPSDWANVVTGYGADPTGTADSTAAIQAAINALETTGGTVYLPRGVYKISAALTFGNLNHNIVLQGGGGGASFASGSLAGATVIKQTSTTAHGLSGNDANEIYIRDLCLLGPASGTGDGIHFTWTSNTNVFQVSAENVAVSSFGGNGVYANTLLMSNFRNVVCSYNAYGFNLVGAGTSLSFDSCWANGNSTYGWYVSSYAYCTWNACGADGNGTGWYLTACKACSINGSGAENNTTDGLVLAGTVATGVHGFIIVSNNHYGVHVTSTSYRVTLEGVYETAGSGAVNSIIVDGGAITTLINCGEVVTAVSLPSNYTFEVLDNGISSIGGTITTAHVNSAVVSSTGITGATAASRYVGATASGAPASGTFALGDFVIDQTGAVWVCTVAGTPGTWVAGSGGGGGITPPAGDIGGTTGSPTVAKIQGTAIAAPSGGATHFLSAAGTWLPAGGSASALVPLSAPVTASTVTAAVGQFIQCDTTSNSIAVTLPATGAADQSQIGVKMITQGSSAGVPYTVTITCGTGDHFNVHTTGPTTMTLSMASQGVTLQYDNSLAVWYVLGDDIPLGQADIRYGSTVGTIPASTGSQNLTLITAAVWNVTLTGITTFVFEGPATPAVQNLTVYLTQGGSTTYNYTVTWPGSVTWLGGTPPPITTGNGALTVVQFQTINGGTGWTGAVLSNAATPLPVVDGGTGLNALTAYAPLVGGTTSSGVLQQAATGMGTSGNVLTSNGSSALPTWQAGGGGGFTSPMTTLGDLIYENATPAAARLAGNTTSAKNFLTQTGTGSVSAAPGWGTIAAGDLPTGTTSTQGALQLDGTSGDIQPAGQAAAFGAKGQAADAKHIHPPGSSFLCTPTAYAPASLTTLTVTGTTYAAFSSANVNTGSFTAPASGSVVVTFSGVVILGASSIAFGFALSAHGAAGTLYGNSSSIIGGSTTNWNIIAITFLVTGLTPGTAYNFDLCGAAGGSNTLNLKCLGSTSTTLAAGAGAPAVLTVQGV